MSESALHAAVGGGDPARARGPWLRAALLLAGLGAGVALLWLAARGVDTSATLRVLERGRVSLVAAAIVLDASILLMGAALWRALLPRRAPVAYGRMLEVTAIMAAIVNTVPALVGHVSGVALLARERGVGARAAAAVLALDQLGEALSKIAVLAAVAMLLPLPGWMRAAVGTIAAGALVLLIVMLLAARVTHPTSGGVAAGTFMRRVVAWCVDLEVLRSPSRAATALAIALAMKAAEALALVAVQHALGVELPLASALLVLAAVNLATMLPVSPGNVGTYEAAAVAAYLWLGVDRPTAVALALASHACYLAAMVGGGAAATLFRSGRSIRA